MQSLPPVLFLMGPTASGKTTLAIQLAQQLNAEIISVDSALVFRGMDIGTAKPSLTERAGIVHHLIDILDPKASFSTGAFRREALSLMQAISARGKLPILVGGTMLYFNALLKGLAQLPNADIAIRQQLMLEAEKWGKTAQHERLQKIDPIAAARIHPNDPQRVQRALEVYLLTGKTITELHQAASRETLPYHIIKFVITPQDRDFLHQRIAHRFKLMLANGFIEEVENLYKRTDLHPDLPAIRAVGYRQVWAYLDGELKQDEMQEQSIIATRQLAKRQLTWLRKETDAQHFYAESPDIFQKISQQYHLLKEV